jgi:hypothetical protein
MAQSPQELHKLFVRLQAQSSAMRQFADDARDRSVWLRQQAEEARDKAVTARERVATATRRGGHFQMPWQF